MAKTRERERILPIALRQEMWTNKVYPNQMCRKTKIDGYRFYKILSGQIIPTDEEKKKIAKALNRKVDYLFP